MPPIPISTTFRPHVSELRHQALGVQGGIDFTKVRLHPTYGFSHPPAFLRARQHDSDGGEENDL
jgi:hypothetical protein